MAEPIATTTAGAGETTAPSTTTTATPTTAPTTASSTTTSSSESPVADVTQSTHEADKHLVIRQITPDIITFTQPFSRGGLAIGGRQTAVKLPSSDIFLYVSTPHSPATAETLAKFGGEVKWLVTPDGEHNVYFEEYVKAYPNAQTIGVERFKEKLPKVNWTGLFGLGGESQQYGFEPHISLHRVSAHMNDELVAIHHDSGTLIEADMVFNLPPTESYSRAGGLPTMAKLLGGGATMSPDGFVHQHASGILTKNKDLLRRELKPIMEAKWDRMIPCHGEIIETGARVQWEKIWGKYA